MKRTCECREGCHDLGCNQPAVMLVARDGVQIAVCAMCELSGDGPRTWLQQQVSLDPDNPSVPPLPAFNEPSRKLQALRAREKYLTSELEIAGPARSRFIHDELEALEAAIASIRWVSSVWNERARLKRLRLAEVEKKSPPENVDRAEL